jgi:hypothetical protein
MKYIYTSLFHVMGGPFYKADQVLFERPDVSVILTSQPDDRSSQHDREFAIWQVHLDCIVSGEKMTEIRDLNNRVNEKIITLRKRRKVQLAGSLALLIEIKGEISLNNPILYIDREDFSYGFELLKDFPIEENNSNKLNAITASCILEANGDCLMDKMSSGVYLLQENDRPLYTTKFRPEVFEPFIPTTFNSGNKDSIILKVDWLIKNTGFLTIAKLIRYSFESKNDPLRGFIFIWNALEIFTDRLFKLHNAEIQKIISESRELQNQLTSDGSVLPNGTQSSLIQRWVCIASYLNMSNEADINSFKKTKKNTQQLFSRGNSK